ncbi:MAG: hypothetical protein ACRCYS_00260 [Beijerinckiaceae bacterium]
MIIARRIVPVLVLLGGMAVPALAQSPFEGRWSGQATQTNNFPPFQLNLQISGVTATEATIVRETSQSQGPVTFKGSIANNALTFGDRVTHTMTVQGGSAKIYMRNISDGTTAEATLTKQ